MNLIMRAKKIVNQSSDFPVRRTGSYRHKKALNGLGRLALCSEPLRLVVLDDAGQQSRLPATIKILLL